MAEKQQKCYVYLDGRLIGNVKSGKKFSEEIRKNRRLGVISGEVNVSYVRKLNEVHINADRGRARKPYIVVEEGASRLTPELMERLKSKEIDFNYLVRRGIIEYLDAEEEENTKVALDESQIDSSTTHLEIDKASILGLTMNLIVFPEYNSIGRHPISSNFAKQSQGFYRLQTGSTTPFQPSAAFLPDFLIRIVNKRLSRVRHIFPSWLRYSPDYGEVPTVGFRIQDAPRGASFFVG